MTDKRIYSDAKIEVVKQSEYLELKYNMSLLSGEWEKSKITPRLLNRLAEIVVENPFLVLHEIKELLQEEGVCEEISDPSLYSALRQMDGRKLIRLMREKAGKSVRIL